MSVRFEGLCAKLGYQFKDISLLTVALSHCSYGGVSNERLEFLGDSILSFVITDEIYSLYPQHTEGQLSRLRSSLVMGETLAALAKELELGRFILLGSGEKKSGGSQRQSILADTMEAIIGAIYLDQGLDVCRDKVLAWFRERLQNSQQFSSSKDAKTRLQEVLQAHKYPLPNYKVVDIAGEDHAQVFHIACHVDGIERVSYGEGASRRKAEQAAALIFLEFLEEIFST